MLQDLVRQGSRGTLPETVVHAIHVIAWACVVKQEFIKEQLRDLHFFVSVACCWGLCVCAQHDQYKSKRKRKSEGNDLLREVPPERAPGDKCLSLPWRMWWSFWKFRGWQILNQISWENTKEHLPPKIHRVFHTGGGGVKIPNFTSPRCSGTAFAQWFALPLRKPKKSPDFHWLSFPCGLGGPSTGWMLYYLCFIPSTAIGPPLR